LEEDMRRRLTGLLCVAAMALILPVGSALAAGGTRTIHFHGEVVRAPAAWPVIRLAQHPRACVRLDRRAVYLGTPGSSQHCPASAIGRRRAILVDPGASASASSAGGARVPLRRLESAGEFTGLGFDACAAPSRRSMAAWGSSPYRAIGVYIGGSNRACSQPNLSASWVGEQVDRGWHLIPTYVGLQAPTSSCISCAELNGAGAASQGAAAASDAVADARAIAIGPGSPIYFDMESYTRTGSATAATMTFLAAWTTRLHALGYTSGVYSSSASGIADLAARWGTGYTQPDDLWIANWNGARNTADPYVPARAWSDHQRIHQYRGGHNETYGGVTINIDSDYVEGATVGEALPGDDDPRGRVEVVEAPLPGHVRVSGWAFDPNSPSTPVEVRAYVGGRSGSGREELGALATLSRPDIGARYRAAGADHGFDASFPTIKNGRQRVCVYAADIGPGSDRVLGCRQIRIGVAVTLSNLRARRGAVRVRLRCHWPVGSECPGQAVVRAWIRVRARHGRTRAVRVRLARARFALTGGAAAPVVARLTRRGRQLVARPGRLRAQLVVAIPRGRRFARLTLP
jgi:hypothetical protein